jgi:hypothetical protein
MWVTSFYPIFWYSVMPPAKVDYTAFTHLVIFTTEVSASSPYFREMPGTVDSCNFDGGLCGGYNTPSGSLKAVVDSAHAHGVKVLFCVAGLGGTSVQNAITMYTDSVKRAAYLHYVLGKNGWANRRNFDGVDFDFEYPSYAAADCKQFRDFIRQVRDTLNTWNPNAVITFDVASDLHPAFTGDTALFNSDKIQQINIMAYGMAAGSSVTGFSSPLFQPKSTYTNYNGSSWFQNPYNQGITAWSKAGIKKKKIGILIPFEMEKTSGVDAPGQTRINGFSFTNYSEVLGKLNQYPASYHWDDIAKVPWLGFTESGTKWFYTYEDTLSIRLKIQAAKDSGVGGIGIWELGRGYVSSANPPDQLLKTVKKEMGLSAPTSIPDVPILSNPLNNAINQSISLVLTWNASSGASTYSLQVSTNSNFTTTIYNLTNLTSTSQLISGLSNNTMYFWRVNATNSLGTSQWSNPIFSFTTIVAIPSPPALLTPADGVSNVSTSTTLRWEASSTAASYKIEVSNSRIFTTTVFSKTDITSTSQLISGLSNNTTYYWRVNAVNIAGTSPWSSPVFSFTTLLPPPPAPELSRPANTVNGVPTNTTLLWHESSGAISYNIQVATDSSFVHAINNDSLVVGTSKEILSLLENTAYYWRVKGKNTAGNGSWSTTWKFTTAQGTTYQYTVNNGWNLISVPFKVANPQSVVLYPTAVTDAFDYNPTSGYTKRDTLLNGVGYWLRFPSNQSVSVTGVPIINDTVDVFQGWNIIGSISKPMATDEITTIPTGIVGSIYYVYLNSHYVEASVLQPGTAYAVKVSQNGKLILSSPNK